MYLYLVFSKTDTWLSRVLQLFIKSKYVHVSVSLDKDLHTMYSFGRVNPDNPFSGGFSQENLSEGVFKKNRNCECVVYRIGITEEQHQLLVTELERFIASKEYYRYNLLGLFTAKMNVPFKRHRYYFCSQFVSELLVKSHILQLEHSPELIKPTDLLNIEGKEEVFKGFVREYIETSYSM